MKISHGSTPLEPQCGDKQIESWIKEFEIHWEIPKNKDGERLGKDTLIYRPLSSTHIHTLPHNTYFPASTTKKTEEMTQSFWDIKWYRWN